MKKLSVLWLILVVVVMLTTVCCAFAAGVMNGPNLLRVVAIVYMGTVMAGVILLGSYVRQWPGWLGAGNTLICVAMGMFVLMAIAVWLEEPMSTTQLLASMIPGLDDRALEYYRFSLAWTGSHYLPFFVVTGQTLRYMMVPLTVFVFWLRRRGSRTAGTVGIALTVVYLGVCLLPLMLADPASPARGFPPTSSARSLISIAQVKFALLLSLVFVPACLIGLRRGWNSIRWIAIGAAATFMGLTVTRMLMDSPGQVMDMAQSITTFVLMASVLLHLGQLADVRPGHVWVKWSYLGLVCAASVLLLGVLVYGIWVEPGSSGGSSSMNSAIEVTISVLFLFLIGGSLVLMLTHAFDKALPAEQKVVEAGTPMAGSIQCARCQGQVPLKAGPNACPACGLPVHLTVHSPACATCGYLLIGHAYEKCPECGTSVAGMPAVAV